MKTILVTGGAGFLGTNLCSRLLNEGNRVICMDNFFTGNLANINTFLNHPNFRFIKHDVCDPIVLDDEKIDQIYNMACPASPPFYQRRNSIKTTKTCVFGAINTLDLAKKHQATILQASTSEVYGFPQVHPQIESYYGNVNPIGIRACYDEGKRCAESLFFDYWHNEGVDIKVARIFNTYGPYMSPNDGRVISNFVCQALSGQGITIYGDGSQTRSFCYVDDLVEALIRMMNSEKEFTGPINLGNPQEITIKQLYELVAAKINSELKIVYETTSSDDPIRRCPDISLAKEKLNWEPKIRRNEGLDKTIEYFREQLKTQKFTFCRSK
ncbi:MAG: SDR family oxidoreductase [Alphaproteobacteria bacterium]|nr:SDR family oxidoreductase [Alphaproteobacteria bacterium]